MLEKVGLCTGNCALEIVQVDVYETQGCMDQEPMNRA
ncbi:hypothetical protein HDF17_002067 [Granulicella arctica]|uniref:Uncharacterized protein n=1 Tax=Granulicella arctica TaxID=940613 RepID=A0A7Y9PH24_9BACT|nr:hypothetical protein [Granulicella arctica]